MKPDQQLEINYKIVTVKAVDKNNRGLFSKQKIKAWGTILDCEPLCTALSMQSRSRFCSTCLLEKPLSRCSQCKVPNYCSKECQKEDWAIHKQECANLNKLTETKTTPQKIPMQILLNIRLWLLRQKKTQIDKKIKQMCNLIQFQTPQKLKQFQEGAVIIASVLEIQRNQFTISDLINQQSIVSLNCFTIQDYLCKEEAVGIGLYWPANFMNHHCHPNVSQIFDGQTLKLIANRPIEMGQQLCISYVPALESWGTKRSLLREGYLFECFCEQCQVNKMFDETLIYLKCPFCSVCSLKKTKFKQAEQDQQQKNLPTSFECVCSGCKKTVCSQLLNKLIDNANRQLNILSKQTDYQSLKKSLLSLRKLISLEDPRMKDCILAVYSQGLAAAANNPKVFSECYILLKQLLETVPKWYRLNAQDEIPYVYVWRYAELGKLAYNLQKLKKACSATEKAYEIIEKIKFKHNFEEVKQLKLRYEQMKIGLSFNKAELFRKG